MISTIGINASKPGFMFLKSFLAGLKRVYIVVMFATGLAVLALLLLGLTIKILPMGKEQAVVLIAGAAIFGGIAGWYMESREFDRVNKHAMKFGWALGTGILKFCGALFVGGFLGFQILFFIVRFNPELGSLPGLAILVGTPIALICLVFKLTGKKTAS